MSKGPISVPDLVGDEATTVSATLLAAELTVGQVTQVFHAGVPVGYVISQTPVAGTPVGPGSAVAYVVSKGPISVPDLVGDEATTVSATLLAAELTVGQVTQVFHAGVPVGYVISQTPVAGTPVGPGSAVAYVVSKGPISVPDLVGDEATTVSATLLAAELTVGQVTQVFHAGVPVGYVISQTPVAGTPVGPGSAVAYVVSKGPISVPDLVGDEATTVSATLLAAELTVGQVTQVFHAGVPVGYVISQTPVAGTPVGPGSAVAYVVSKGPISVPDVLGQTPANAATAISGAGLSPLRGADEYSATVAAGLVSRQDPAAASQVAPLSTVTYVVSKGPAPVSVPLIDGLTADAAATALNGAGLVGVSSSVFSDAVPLGQVFGQSPAAGASVAPGSNVSYVVSLGIEQAAVPTPTRPRLPRHHHRRHNRPSHRPLHPPQPRPHNHNRSR